MQPHLRTSDSYSPRVSTEHRGKPASKAFRGDLNPSLMLWCQERMRETMCQSGSSMSTKFLGLWEYPASDLRSLGAMLRAGSSPASGIYDFRRLLCFFRRSGTLRVSFSNSTILRPLKRHVAETMPGREAVGSERRLGCRGPEE